MFKTALKVAVGVVVGDVSVGLARAYLKAGPNGIGTAKGLLGVYTIARGAGLQYL